MFRLDPIYIHAHAQVSASTDLLASSHSRIQVLEPGPCGRIDASYERDMADLVAIYPLCKGLDRATQLAILAASQLGKVPLASIVHIGSSRGATNLLERYQHQWSQEGHVPPQSSPSTTVGNISSGVRQYLQTTEVSMGNSQTCSTAGLAIMNGIAWIQSGMAEHAIVGGSEAPITDFTIAPMKALRIYSRSVDNDFLSRPLDRQKTENTMVLGEAAALLHIAKDNKGALAKITGYGAAVEQLTSLTSMTDHGEALQLAMQQALQGHLPSSIDAIITHAPGTRIGDEAEIKAIEAVFGNDSPILCNNKWLVGHSLGASAALSVSMAVDMIQKQQIPSIPYLKDSSSMIKPQRVNKILINATGFGGNAVSLLIEQV